MSRRFLRRTLPAFAAVLALGVTGLPAATASDLAPAASQPASSCAASIQLPSKVTIDRPYREVKVTLSDPCKRVDYASARLYGKDGMEDIFIFDNGKRTEYWDVYDFMTTPGAFKTRDSRAHDQNYKDIAVKEDATQVKYGSKTSLATKRSGSKVTFTVAVRAYSPTHETFRPWSPAKVQIQKKVGSSWKYFRTVTVKGGQGTLTATAPGKATYRVVATQDWGRWGSTSSSSTR